MELQNKQTLQKFCLTRYTCFNKITEVGYSIRNSVSIKSGRLVMGGCKGRGGGGTDLPKN